MRTVKYTLAKFGLGTESTQDDQPLEYAPKYQNRFRNILGKGEKRQGLKQLGSTITDNPNLTGIHEYVNNETGVATLFVSGDTGAEGKIWRFNTTTEVFDEVLAGKDRDRMFSAQMGNKLIFVNGVDRNFFTEDAGDTFDELEPIINRGTAASGSSPTVLTDSNITNWATETFVAVNDIVFNATVSAFGIVTSVGTSALDITTIGSAATGLGQASDNQAASDEYELLDLVESNIIPTAFETDNVAVATSGTSTGLIAVSGVDFSTTEMRQGDFIRNTTRSAVMRVESVSANVVVTSVAGQSSGDSLIFLKKAMPIATFPHVHFGRLYLIDARDQSKVRVSGPNDPQDFTTSEKTLSSSSIDFGSKQPKSDTLLTLSTFQRYLVAASRQAVFVDDGVNPIVDTSGKETDLQVVGLFPQGCVSRLGLASIGNNMVYAAHDGLRQFRAGNDFRVTETNNISEQIKTEVTNLIESKLDDQDSIQIIHYKRRNWVMLKIGDTIYNYNYTPTYEAGQTIPVPSWTKFTGRFAQQNEYFVRRDSDLITTDSQGNVYQFDKGNYDDAGDNITTIYRSPWQTLEEGEGASVRIKDVRYIKPIFETTSQIAYTVEGEGDFEFIAEDSITTTAEGGGIIGQAVVGQAGIGGTLTTDDKLPLRLRGEQFRFTFQTETTNGPDIISHYYIYGNVFGRE